jgi:Transposase DDE domain group 1
MEFEIGYSNKEVTPWGGLIFLRQMLDKLKFREMVESMPELPVPGSNRGYDSATIIEAFMASIWCGANRFMHTEITRHDPSISRIFNWKRTPAQDTYKRFFAKFTSASQIRISQYFYHWLFQQVVFDNFTLDIDSSVLTRYGNEQEGSKKGYNPKKPGRLSHHPLLAFVSDVKLVANMWLRSGDTSASNNFIGFLEDTLAKLEGKTISLIRLDSGFCSGQIFDYLEDRKPSIQYIVAARFHQPVQKLIGSQQVWLSIDQGIQVSETTYQAHTWSKPRRMVIVRQAIKERPQAPGKTLKIFQDEEVYMNFRYSAFITNMNLAPVEVWRLYRGRADAENRIKELKADFGFDSFNMKSFQGTEAALTFAMLGYNLMALFRQFVLQGKTQQTLSTLRYKTFAIGAYFEKIEETMTLKLALNLKRREWFEGLWGRSKLTSIPLCKT